MDFEEQITKAIADCESEWEADGFRSGVTIEWSARLSRSLGIAYPVRKLIRLNMLLQDFSNLNLLREVVVHELAHLLVYARHGRAAKSHGKEWCALMSQMGLEARRAIPVKMRKSKNPKKFVYEHRCPRCHAVRVARRPHPNWQCVACNQAGLNGELVVASYPAERARS